MTVCIRHIAIAAALVLLGANEVHAQQLFFNSIAGRTMTYDILSDEGGRIATLSETPLGIDGTLRDGTVHFNQAYYESDGSPFWRGDPDMKMDVILKDGHLTAWLESPRKALKASQYMYQGNAFFIPSSPSVGLLDEVSFPVLVGSMKGSIRLTDRQVVSIEQITVPAGTFQAFKVTENQNSRIVGFSFDCSLVTWYVEEIGIVRQECYKKGTLVDVVQLRCIE